MPKLRSTSDEPLKAERRAAVAEPREDLARLRLLVDQLHDGLQFVLSPQGSRPLVSRIRITSLPKDPAAADFLDRINAVPPEQTSRSKRCGPRSLARPAVVTMHRRGDAPRFSARTPSARLDAPRGADHSRLPVSEERLE